MVDATKRKSENKDSLVETFWQLKVHLPVQSTFISRLSASVLGHLILAPASQTSTYSYNGQECSVTGTHILYPQQSSLFLHQPSQFFLGGAELALGTTYLMAKKKVIARAGRTSNLADAIALDFREPESLDNVIAIFENFFQELNLHEQIDRHYLLTKEVEGLLATDPHQSVSELAANFDISQRTLERSFKTVVGLSLKAYQNISRFNRFLEEFVEPSEDSVLNSESQYYFYDQSHCIRQFHSYVGMSPRSLLKDSDLVSSRYRFKNS